MTIQEALEFIHSVSWKGSIPGLSRVEQLSKRLGNPQRGLKFIHVAGTNGKGSTCAMLSSVLTEAGYKTGLYTSPYITRFNERMQVGGVPVSDAELAEITEYIRPHALAMEDSPTEFELVCVIGFEFFRRRGCDVVVLETGMGGRLDATNIIEENECAVITSIALDHTAELGGTLAEIAAEKAGIIKPGCPVVSYVQNGEAAAVIASAASAAGAELVTADFSSLVPHSDSIEGQSFSYGGHSGLSLPLLGGHQLKNAAVALETIDVLRRRGWKIPDAAISEGLKKTVWPARFELLSKRPWFVLDGGHNPECAAGVRESLLKYFPASRRVLIMGVMADKDYLSLAEAVDAAADEYITVTPNTPRSLPAAELALALGRFGKPVTAAGTIDEGVRLALAAAGEDGVVCAFGSLYMAGDIRQNFIK